jgi:glycosyltransferase involved in cell wall biosynthesis
VRENFPKISVITPSFNQGQFIEETIQSVLMQGYPNLEYLIMDGGSTDNTVEIIKKYTQHITFWQSTPDKGQADAINQGFSKATGDILCWLNSDDFFLPGTLLYVAQQLNINETTIIAGNCFHFKENSSLAYGSDVLKANDLYQITDYDFYIQPSSFWTKKAWEKVGALNLNMHYCFDWEWFIRAHEKGVTSIFTNKYLSAYRIHEAHKSGSGAQKRLEEIQKIYTQYNKTSNLEIFNYLLVKKDKIKKILSFTDRYGFQKREHIIVKILFPKLFKYQWRLISQILYSLN